MEIPMRYVKANQTGIVLFVLASMLIHPAILIALWLIEIVGLLSGGRLNVFVRLANSFLTTKGRETQAAELTRFNNALAVIFLTLAVLSYALGWLTAAYVFAGMLLIAAGVALLGYCIGCTLYFQYKQFLARSRHSAS